jgi:holo-[acyl-carrier protein] synthase
MIQGVGNDILEIERMRLSIERHGHHLLNRLFTVREQDYCFKYKDPFPHFAGRFAAKEAIVKALGTGFGADVVWHDVEIINNEKGKPEVVLSPFLIKNFHDPIVLISISHCEKYATAVAIWSSRK